MHGCRHRYEPSPNLTLAHEVSPQPPRVGQVTIELRLTDAGGTAVTGALLKLEGNMSHAGMVPVFGEAKETEPGRYRSTLELSMAGDWYILVTVTLPDDRKFQRQFKIEAVAPV
ncbi:MAG TPA: FixH family protein [Pyrinomonadaceae bacterium]|nr:FixH family protein [Pyrinomonadaceae bacterium]